MRRRVSSLLCIVLMVQFASPAVAMNVYVVCLDANVYDQPAKSSRVFGEVQFGREFEVLDRDQVKWVAGWVPVRYEGTAGWLHQDCVSDRAGYEAAAAELGPVVNFGKESDESPPPEPQIELSKAAVDSSGSYQQYLLCRDRGRAEANSVVASGGSFAGGFFGGLFLGLIGTVIAVVAQSKPEPSARLMSSVEREYGADCAFGFSEGYRDSGKSKKQTSALLGGLLGTVVIVGVILTQSN